MSLYEQGAKNCYKYPILTVYLAEARRIGLSFDNLIVPMEEDDISPGCDSDYSAQAAEFHESRNEIEINRFLFDLH